MKDIFRTTLRLDMDKPAERQAAELLRKQRQEQNETYSALIASAVNAYYGDRNSDTKSFDDNQRDEIRAIVRGGDGGGSALCWQPSPALGTGSSAYPRE